MKDEDLEIIQVNKGASKNDDENDQVDKLSESCKLERPSKKMTNKKIKVIDLLDSSDEIEEIE